MSFTPTSYAEKLKDPRWQRKRLEVFERAKFTCEECSGTDKTLHVHHKRYIRGREPWEYEDKVDLACLCEDCHANASLVDKILNGKYDSAPVNSAVESLKSSLALQFSDCSRPDEIAATLDFLSVVSCFIDLAIRWELGMPSIGDAAEICLNALRHEMRIRRHAIANYQLNPPPPTT